MKTIVFTDKSAARYELSGITVRVIREAIEWQGFCVVFTLNDGLIRFES